jgi:hypothetical protein
MLHYRGVRFMNQKYFRIICKLIFENTPQYISLPLAGRDKGEGEPNLFTPTLPHRRGRGIN